MEKHHFLQVNHLNWPFATASCNQLPVGASNHPATCDVGRGVVEDWTCATMVVQDLVTEGDHLKFAGTMAVRPTSEENTIEDP